MMKDEEDDEGKNRVVAPNGFKFVDYDDHPFPASTLTEAERQRVAEVFRSLKQLVQELGIKVEVPGRPGVADVKGGPELFDLDRGEGSSPLLLTCVKPRSSSDA